MPSERERVAATSERLQNGARLNLALDEALIHALSDELHAHEGGTTAEQIEPLRHFLRSQRVGMLRHRAQMAALGIDV